MLSYAFQSESQVCISCPSHHWEWVIWWTSLEFGERFATFGCAASVLFLFFKSSNLKDCQLWAQSKRRFKRWSERHCKQCCHLGFNSQLIQCCLMCGRLECWTESETSPETSPNTARSPWVLEPKIHHLQQIIVLSLLSINKTHYLHALKILSV